MIVDMKRATLVAMQADEEALLKKLQEIGTVEILHMEETDTTDARLDGIQERLRRFSESMEVVKPFAPKKSFFSPQRREESLSNVDADAISAITIADEISEIRSEQNHLFAERGKSEAMLRALEPWANLCTPMECVGDTKRTRIFSGFLQSKDVNALLEQDYLETQIVDEGSEYALLIVCRREDYRAAQSFLKTVEWTDFAFPKRNGTPAKAMEEIRVEIRSFTERIEALEARVSEYGEKLTLLENASDATTIVRDRCLASNDLSRLSRSFILEGWVRADEAEKTGQTIASVTDAYYWDVREPSEDEVPPTVIQNNSVVRPFEAVQSLYAYPVYGTTDGTPYMTPFYILLFGLMLSDSGYGLLLSLGALAYLRIKKPRGMSGRIARVLVWCGLSTLVWGVFVGSCFGITQTHASGGVFDRIADVFARWNIFPMWIDPMEDAMLMLGLCFGLGVIHLVAAYLIRAFLDFKNGDWKSAVFDQISWVLIIVGLIVGFFPTIGSMAGFEIVLPNTVTQAALIAAGVGALLILLFKGRNKPKILGKITGGLGELYNITSVLSDILSYARLFGLGIATGVIAQVFNTLSGMLMSGSSPVMQIIGPIIAIVLLLVLHTFNIAINTLGAFIHCARLQYVEFYGRFFEGGGREFKPLSYKTKHIQITK